MGYRHVEDIGATQAASQSKQLMTSDRKNLTRDTLAWTDAVFTHAGKPGWFCLGLAEERASAEDAARLAALAAANDRGAPSRSTFLTANWRTVDASGLSHAARKALALHLFLHRAIYAAEPPEQLDERALAASGPTEGEAALLRLEILRARRDPQTATQQAAVEQRSPGLRWRVAAMVAGNGRLADSRRSFGAELERVGRPQPYAR